MDELLERLDSIAAHMNACRRTWFARLNYDMMSDALWWSDERPDFADAEDHWCLRPVFRYRTTLILDAPEPQWKPFWDRSLELFPDWPGFHTSRISPNSKLIAFLQKHADAAMADFDELPD